MSDAGDLSEENGICCEISGKDVFGKPPLVDVEVNSQNSNYQLLTDYSDWFINHPSEGQEEGDPSQNPEDEEILRSASNLFGVLTKVGIAGGIYGFVLGSFSRTMDSSLTGMIIGLALGALIGLLIGWLTAMGTQDLSPKQKTMMSLSAGIMFMVIGTLAGGFLGAVIVAFFGSYQGALMGTVLGGIIAWPLVQSRRFRSLLWGCFCGATGGSLIQIFLEKPQEALAGNTFGILIGFFSAVVGCLILGFLVLPFFPEMPKDFWENKNP